MAYSENNTLFNPQTVSITQRKLTLKGDLVVPSNAQGLVIFAHGSGSGRYSTRNRYVAQALQKAGLATLLLDLLTPEEEEIDRVMAHLRFDIQLLAERLIGATQWAQENPQTCQLAIGYFGASTGAGAALLAAALLQNRVRAIVSRGGRPDLASTALPQVKASTLLIVGGEDYPIIHLNQEAVSKITAKKELIIIPGATHLFEEPGTLEEVARLAAEWFKMHLAPSVTQSKSNSGYVSP